MLNRYFLDHPRSVGESYGEHLTVASNFGIAMLLGGVACLIHALVQCLFERTASRIINRLHHRMGAGRGADRSAARLAEGAHLR